MAQFERNSLHDILDAKRTQELEAKYGQGRIVFPVYKDKDEIALNIFKSLNARLIDLHNGKLGIPMDDAEKKVGLLSQCQGLQTLVSLVNDFGLKFDDTSYDDRNHRSIRNIMDGILKDIINKLRVSDLEIDEDADEEEDTRELFIFDASPYDSDHFDVNISSIETITWVLPTFFQILQIHVKEHQICKWERNLIRIIRYGLRYINDAYIDGSKNPDGKGLKIGWNFAKDCEEPSLYFTFAVAECFLDMYDTFKDVLKYPYDVLYSQLYGTQIDEEARQVFLEHQELFRKEEAENAKKPKDVARHNEYNELIRLFRTINSNDRFGEQDIYEEIRVDASCRFGLLEQHLREISKEIWGFVKNDLSDKFFYNDLATTLTESGLRMSTTSDALFNTVYIVNILIDSGLDEILLMENNQREYDNLLESCQLAVQKAFRTYESLKGDGKDYIVDQFLIGFNERFVVHKDRVNDLRKLRMRVFSLLPMLIHTNNIINTYLVKYPQVNMKKYAGYILDNRYAEKSADGEILTEWIWEKDGYFSGSNYYFVNALKELYDYYEEYEDKYIPIGEKNQQREKKFYEKLTGRNGEITLLKDQHKKELDESKQIISQREAQIEELKQLLEEEKLKKPTIEDGIRELIQKEFDQQFISRLTQAFAQAAKVLAPNTVDPTTDPEGRYTGMYNALLEMVVAECYAKSPTFEDCTPEVFKTQTAHFKADVRAIINHNIDDISSDIHSRSNMYTKLG